MYVCCLCQIKIILWIVVTFVNCKFFFELVIFPFQHLAFTPEPGWAATISRMASSSSIHFSACSIHLLSILSKCHIILKIQFCTCSNIHQIYYLASMCCMPSPSSIPIDHILFACRTDVRSSTHARRASIYPVNSMLRENA